jgi:hypothetical protein
MKTHFRKSFVVGVVFLMLVIAACSGPPPVQPKAEADDPNGRGPVTQERRPPVEEARPQAEAPSKPKPAVKQVPKQAAATPAPSVNAGAQPARPAERTASAEPGTFTLPAPVAPPVAAPAPPPDDIKPVYVEPPPPRKITLPSGTPVAVRMVDSVDSETAHVGETFKGTLDVPIVFDNETVFPKGSEVYVKLSKVQSAGRVSGRSELELQLDRIFLGRKSYLVESNSYVNTGASQAGKTARSAAIGGAIGATIGAISRGGKGAVIGGATGAGAGVGVEAIKKGEQVRVESEARLDFQLEESLDVTLQSPSPTTSQRNNPSGPPRLGTRQ